MRRRRGWTQDQLADRLEELGWPSDRIAVNKFEATRTGRSNRKITLDEAFAYAAALGPSLTYMAGAPESPDEPVAVAPGLAIEAGHVRRWVSGLEPLQPDDARSFHEHFPDDEEALARSVRLTTAQLMRFLNDGRSDKAMEAIEVLYVRLKNEVASAALGWDEPDDTNDLTGR